MTKKFSGLRARMHPDSQARAKANARQLMSQMPLNELRQARRLSQRFLTEVLHIQQSSIDEMERHTDMYISTLRDHIEAMGGQLEIVARFPQGSVNISSFSEIGVLNLEL